MLTKTNYQSYDKFTDKNENTHYCIRSYESESTSDPEIGDTIWVDQKEIRIKSISRRSKCICGGCGPKDMLAIVSEKTNED